MNPTLGIAILSIFLLGLVWLSVSKASDDGFFTSLCTLIVLFSAYQFARLEWGFFVQLLKTLGMSHHEVVVSTGYWVGFLIIVAPGLVVARILAKPKVPFPYFLEKYGAIVIGAAAGVLLFATIIQWFLHFELLRQMFMAPLAVFRPIFHFLGYRAEGFD